MSLNTINFQKNHSLEIAKILDLKKGTVLYWSFKLNNQGIDGLLGKKRGGRRNSLMTLEEEMTLLEELRADSIKGLILTAQTVKKHAEEKLGYEVSKDFAYDLLRRHGWRKITPRPKHPKSNPEIQEEFKKKSLSWSPPHSKHSMQRIKEHS